MDKLEKLRKEIESRLNTLIDEKEKFSNNLSLSEEIFVLKTVLNTIDFMQKEPKEYNGILGENIREIDNEIQRLERLKENPICAYSTSRYTDEERKVFCEDCQEECEYAKKKVPVSEELEEAKRRIASEYMEEVKKETGYKDYVYWNGLEKGIELGANWQKEKLMKNAIELPLYLDGDFLTVDYDFTKSGYKVGDKVKMIIIKEN